jgi:hypothetical protein
MLAGHVGDAAWPRTRPLRCSPFWAGDPTTRSFSPMPGGEPPGVRFVSSTHEGGFCRGSLREGSAAASACACHSELLAVSSTPPYGSKGQSPRSIWTSRSRCVAPATDGVAPSMALPLPSCYDFSPAMKAHSNTARAEPWVRRSASGPERSHRS